MIISIERQNIINKGSLVGFCDVLYNNELIIKGCAVMVNSHGGQFVGMPSKKNEKDGKYYDHCRFKDRATQDEFSHLVISAFNGNSGSSEPKEQRPPVKADVWEE